MSFFESVEGAPDDPILSLGVKCAQDEREQKVNLGVGAYKTAEGVPLVLSSVRRAECRILEQKLNKEYLQIDGLQEYIQAMLKLLYGKHCSALAERRICGVQSVGGSGALRVAGEFLRSFVTDRIYLSSPTWANHPACFAAAGLKVGAYGYYNEETKSFDFAAMMQSLKEIPERSAVLLQACCHNPTGCDPTFEQWKEISSLMKERHLFPLFDSAYQGFGEGLKQDAAIIRHFVEQGHLLISCSSCSKNFGLYGERTGLLSAVCKNKEEAQRVLSQFKKIVRANYSNPPVNGARIVAKILTSTDLRSEWIEELGNMRMRIQEMRKALVSELQALGGDFDFSFMHRQQGMFSYSGLSAKQVEQLQEEFAIYMPKNGRINIAGLSNQNISYVAKAVVEVARAHETDPV